jgi:hypothetical protein
VSAPTLTPGEGLDVEVVADSGPGAPAWDEPGGHDEPAPIERTVDLKGRQFPVRPEGVSLLAMMKFATIAKRHAAESKRQRQDPAEVAQREMDGLAALYALLRSCVHPDAWEEFEEHANESGAGQEDLMRVVQQAAQAGSGRPTLPSSGSPGGRSTTAPSSAAGSSSVGSSIRQGDESVQRRLELAGRPDVALVVKRAREASTRSSTG